MRGHFEVELKNSGTLRDEDFFSTPHDELNSLLNSLHTVKRVEGCNQCNDMLAASLLCKVMNGPSIEDPYNTWNIGSGGLASINIEDRDPELIYTEWVYCGGCNIHEIGYPVGTGNSGKRFVEDDISNHTIEAYQNNREELWFRSRWLYLPSQIVTNNIKSIGYFYCYYADRTTNYYRATYGRFRLKNENGIPITITKSSDQVLLVQMKLKFVTV